MRTGARNRQQADTTYKSGNASACYVKSNSDYRDPAAVAGAPRSPVRCCRCPDPLLPGREVVNIIFITGRRGRARQLHITHPTVLSWIAVGISAILVAGMVGGYVMGRNITLSVPSERLDAMNAELERQRSEVASAREDGVRTIDALAVRLAELNAHVVRLNALGRRLTRMGGLEDGEFDFDSIPAMGGPEPGTDAASLGVPEMTQRLEFLASQVEDRQRQLDVLENLLLNRHLSEQVQPQGRPVASGWISSAYGKRTDPFTGKNARHWGVDFAGREGAEIVAVGAGVVTYVGDRYGYGEMVEINHGNGFVTRYAHNKENLVAVGDEVEKGQTIALMGSSGRATGPNLHFEVLRGGYKVNPLEYIRAKD
jgi:murein DD-endopeptidase MepM/ murein hydrolase activator NlpD